MGCSASKSLNKVVQPDNAPNKPSKSSAGDQQTTLPQQAVADSGGAADDVVAHNAPATDEGGTVEQKAVADSGGAADDVIAHDAPATDEKGTVEQVPPAPSHLAF
eukprot:jgi/Tetstr1/453297/TSEL_040289.t1